MRYGSVLSKHNGIPLADGSLYQTIVGSLQYCVLTRLEIAFSVNGLCQFLYQPTNVHW